LQEASCPECGAIFNDSPAGSQILKGIFGALTGNRPIDDIKDDWIYEVRRGIVGGMQKTFGVDGDGTDRFKHDKPKEISEGEIIDIEFEVVEEDNTLKKKPKGTTMEDLSPDVQEALRKRMNVDSEDDESDSSE
jgi:hypothetical protein